MPLAAMKAILESAGWTLSCNPLTPVNYPRAMGAGAKSREGPAAPAPCAAAPFCGGGRASMGDATDACW